jgi:hypothetical protein
MDIDRTKNVINHRQEGTAHVLIQSPTQNHEAWDWFLSLNPERRAHLIQAAYHNLPPSTLNRIERA